MDEANRMAARRDARIRFMMSVPFVSVVDGLHDVPQKLLAVFGGATRYREYCFLGAVVAFVLFDNLAIPVVAVLRPVSTGDDVVGSNCRWSRKLDVLGVSITHLHVACLNGACCHAHPVAMSILLLPIGAIVANFNGLRRVGRPFVLELGCYLDGVAKRKSVALLVA